MKMSRPVNALKLIKNTTNNINPNYDATVDNLIDMRNSSKGMFNLMYKSFIFGYAQGVKAQKKGRAFNE